MKSTGAKPSGPNNMLFTGVLALTLASIYSAVLQIEKVYFMEVEEKPIANAVTIPYLTALKFQESMVLCAATFVVLVIFIVHQMYQLLCARLNMPIVKIRAQLPYLGTALEFLTHTPWDLMESWHRSYGSIYAFKLLGQNMVSIEKPEHLKEILQSKIKNVRKDSNFSYKPFLPILGTGIVTSEGKSWMNQRRKISTAFKVDILEAIPGATLSAIQRLMVKLDRCVSTGDSLDLAEDLRHLTLQVISETFLSLDASESDNTFATMYLPIVEESNKRVWRPERSYMFFTPSFWNHIVSIRRLNNYVSKLITTRWELRKEEKLNGKKSSERQRGDILDKVLNHFEKENPGKGLTAGDIRQLRDEFKTFMLAGHETSAAMMTWTFYELMRDDDLMKKIENEAESVFGVKDWLADDIDASALPSRDELSNLALSEACLKESLRLYSVVPTVIRQIAEPTQIENHILPKGASVVINIQSTHHNEKYWPKPMTFDPTRFVNKRPAPFTFLPFIDGPRNCLGQYLALLESKMVVSLISHRYNFTAKQKVGGEKDEDPRHRFVVPIIPKDSVDVTVTKRI